MPDKEGLNGLVRRLLKVQGVVGVNAIPVLGVVKEEKELKI